MIASPVFSAMLGGSFEEAETSKVNLVGKKLETVQWMLDYLYPDSVLEITGNIIEVSTRYNLCEN